MKTKVIINIDTVGELRYLQEMDKDIAILLYRYIRGIIGVVDDKDITKSSEDVIGAFKSVKLDTGVLPYDYNLDTDILIRYRTENRGLYDKKFGDLNWDATKTIHQRLALNKKIRTDKMELFDINILVGNIKDINTEKAISEAMCALDASGVNPDVSAFISVFAFDEFVNFVKEDFDLAALYKETINKRKYTLYNYINTMVKVNETCERKEDINKELQDKFGKIIDLDSSDGLLSVCI